MSESTPKFVKHRVTGIMYDYNPAALKRAENDYVPVYEEDLKGLNGGDDAARKQKIIDAVKTIDPATYSAPAGGRPAMPKVGAVSELVGFKVTADEVAEAVTAINAE